MPLKGCGSKVPVKGSSSRTSKGARDENLPINPPVQPPSILKAPAKTSIDGIPFNTFLTKFCRDLYTKVFCQRSLILKRKLHLESFLGTPIPTLFVELGWLPLANFTGTACALLFRMFYSNIIEYDLDESYLKSSLFGIVVKVTLEVIVEVLGIPLVEAPFVSDFKITFELLDRVSIDLWGEVRVLATFLSFLVYVSSHQADICKKGCILLSRILHREPINLIKGAIGSKKKVCHTRAKRKFGENDSDSDVDSSKIFAQSTLLSEQICQLQYHMERGFSLINGQMFCNMDQLHALEDFVHKHLS
ncbi:hypothetical protein PVL29_004600 [Vitis rotundifolia]|uniref:Uncharacterized protein n=1 Tax=Vitis rotundifolia TaxID=103349 RepID=A0AA39A9I2_VITRO|nr:hypothetical protein PVL29_004600 [Vitis rotundifolia]